MMSILQSHRMTITSCSRPRPLSHRPASASCATNSSILFSTQFNPSNSPWYSAWMEEWHSERGNALPPIARMVPFSSLLWSMAAQVAVGPSWDRYEETSEEPEVDFFVSDGSGDGALWNEPSN
uniref:Uncharacterized protein n=1 Tax=Proboscia inermis TaxID=420281 RepID=A0A7S0CF81_9STRA